MATSSITHNFVIEGKERVERFANAIEASWNEVIPERPKVGRLVTNPKELKGIMAKFAERYGANAKG
ncbi:MAG: hypothetical protein IJU98_09565 [Synergistaceae bacterium]|nr:hypothetical protein [Synergistaceae bacterium]